MSSTIFQPGFCVKHPLKRVAPGQKFLCEDCAGQTSIATVKACINHPSKPAVELNFCDDCNAWRLKRKAEIETAQKEAARKEAIKRTGNPNATDQRGRVADPAKKAAREAEKAEREARKAEEEAAALDFEAAHLRAMTTKTEPCPILVLMRGKDPQEILEAVAKLARKPLRSGKIHFLPRLQRTRKDALRIADPIIGKLLKDLDPKPYALWIPLDPNGGNKSDLPWFREKIETKVVNGEKVVSVSEEPANPPEHANPSAWNEIADMTGAEVLDLRNYPDVLAEVKDLIESDLDKATEWSDILREIVADYRNGVCFAKTAKLNSTEYFELIALDPSNEKIEDPIAPVQAHVKEVANDFTALRVQGLLSGRSIVIEVLK